MGYMSLRELNTTYDVSYIINGGKEAESAVINVEAENVDVKVSMRRSSRMKEALSCASLFIRDTGGCYRYPSEQDSFWVRIKEKRKQAEFF